MNRNKQHIVLFDGVCNLCNNAVKFIIKKDSKSKFKFVSLQSVTGLEILKKYHTQNNNLDTIVLITENRLFFKSSAILKILNEIGGIWKIFYILIIIPRPLRNWIYDVIAKSRYRVFGKSKTCIIDDQINSES